jgi:hypothetical protein
MSALPPSPFITESALEPSRVADTVAGPDLTDPPVPAAVNILESSTSTGGQQERRLVALEPPPAGVSAREKFRREVAEALTGWRMGCIAPRTNGAEVLIFREAMADIIKFRLRIAYMPLFQGLERIQDRVGILASLRAEPYAPPARH